MIFRQLNALVFMPNNLYNPLRLKIKEITYRSTHLFSRFFLFQALAKPIPCHKQLCTLLLIKQVILDNKSSNPGSVVSRLNDSAKEDVSKQPFSTETFALPESKLTKNTTISKFFKNNSLVESHSESFALPIHCFLSQQLLEFSI